MDETTNVARPAPKLFYYRMAWYSLVAPFVVVAMIYAIGFTSSLKVVSDDFITKVLFCTFPILLSSCLSGLVSFVVMIDSKWKLGWLVAVFGVLASIGVGVLNFYAVIMSLMGRNC